MKRVVAGAHLPTPWLFNPQNAKTNEPTIAWDAVSFPSASTRYSFLQTGEQFMRARPNEHFQRTGPPSNAD